MASRMALGKKELEESERAERFKSSFESSSADLRRHALVVAHGDGPGRANENCCK